MTTPQDKLHDKIHSLAATAKQHVDATLDKAAHAAGSATTKTAQLVHDASAKVMQVSEQVKELAK